MKKQINLSISMAALAAVLLSGCKGSGSDRLQTETPRAPLKEYTKDYPGEWAGLEEEHYPRVTIDKKATENVVIQVNFPINHAPDHYIEKIGIMDKDGNDIIIKKFNPNADYWGVRLSIPNIQKGWKAYARCSLHDLWTAPLEDNSTFSIFR